MLPILVDPRQILGSVPPKPKREKGNKNYRHPKPRTTFQSFTSRQNLPLDLDVPRPAAHATAEPTLATFFLNKEVYSSAKHEASQACSSDSLPPTHHIKNSRRDHRQPPGHLLEAHLQLAAPGHRAVQICDIVKELLVIGERILGGSNLIKQSKLISKNINC